MSKAKPKISARKPPAADVAAFVHGPAAPAAGSVQRSESPNVYMPARKRGFLAGQPARRTTIYFPTDLFDALERRCFEGRVEISLYVTEAVRAALASAGKGGGAKGR